MTKRILPKTVFKIFSVFQFCLMLMLIASQSATAQSLTIGSANTNTNGNGSDPIDGFYNYMHYQTVYTAAELSAGGMSSGAAISSLGFSVTEAYGGGALPNYTVSMAHTLQADAATYINVPLTTVIAPFNFTPVIQSAGAYQMIPFTTNFVWDGVSNIVIDICSGSNPYIAPYGGVSATTMTAGASWIRQDGGSGVCNLATGVVSPGVFSYGVLNNRPDIQLDYIAGSPCGGTPAPGNTVGPASVCPNTNFTLSLQNLTTGSGVSYQWESSPDGVTWSPIGSNSGVISVSQTSPTYYQATVTCATGGASGTSTPIQVGINPFLSCYCSSAAINAFDGEITNVTIDALNNSSTCASSNQLYTDYTASVPALTLMQSQSASVSVMAGSCGGSYDAWVKVFIDYDQDGTFTGPDEEVFSGAPPGGQYTPAGVAATGNFVVSPTALTGTTQMRVILQQTTVAANVLPCGSYNYGETEDYLVDIIASTNCSGTPVAGTASGPASICPNAPFTLSASGYSIGTGNTFQWYESPSGAGAFVAIAGATLPFYNVSAGQIADMDYHMMITCSNGGGTDVTNDVTVTMNSFASCYCVPTYTNGGTGDHITNVTLGVLNSSSTGNPVPHYIDYTSQQPGTLAIPDLLQGASYDLSLTFGPDANQYNGVWIDYDQNGVFDAAEFTTSASNNTSGGTSPTIVQINVPLTALTGQTRMRIRGGDDTQPSDGQACGASNSTYGEGEDYLVNIIPTSACAGAPVAGTAAAPAGICPGASFNVSLTGFTLATGIGIQWESSPAGTNVWSAISGATTATYNVTGQSSDMDYHAIVTCANGGGTDISNAVTVTMNTFYSCYCTTNLGGATGNSIENIEILGTTLNNSSPGTAAGFYTSYAPVGSATGTLIIGQSYTLNFTFGAASIGSVWIDFDQSGTFDPGEWTQLTINTASGNVSITVPISALSGLTGMRIRSRGVGNPNGATDPCSLFGTGETEDYIVTIDPGTPCGGAPVAGTATGPSGICNGQNVNLSLSGYTIGSGITVQWESTAAGTSSWAPIAGATNSGYVVTGQSTATDYRAIVTCSNGGGTDISNTVTVNMNSFYSCYCITNLGGATGNSIENIEIVGTTLNNSSPGTAAGFYTSYPPTGSATGTLIIGQTYTLNYTFGAASMGSVWIDFDQSGTFDPGEWTQLTINGASGNVSISVPVTALAGLTGMRVRSRGVGNTNGPTDPCTLFGSGETEDYIITIDPGTPCSGAPVAGTASGPAGACLGTPFTLSLSGFTIGNGISFQWQLSTTGPGGFADIAGATNPSYTGTQAVATDYQAIVTCSAGPSSATSNTVTVIMNSFVSCYCFPTYTGNIGDNITNVTLGVLNNSSTVGAAPYYTDYTSQQPSPISIPDIYAGGPADVSISTGTDGNQYNGVWVDFNQDGIFDATEFFTTGSNGGANSTVVVSLVVPAGAVLGQTRMRVRAGDDSQPLATQACGPTNSNYGEAEDYLVNIVTPPSCIAPAGLSATNLTSSSATVNWGAVTGAAGYEYAVDGSAAAPASGTSTTNLSEPVSGLSGSTVYYLHVRTDCGGGSFSTWTTLSFQTLISNDNASGAIPITLGASCSGSPFFNTGATQSAGEPAPSCVNSAVGYQTVWYSFVAPASGAVKISNDFTGGTMGTDTRIALFTAIDPTDYATFSMLSCDDDNGVAVTARSIMYGTGLTPGSTYYIEVDGYGNGTIGTFCLEVKELDNTMLASTGSCTGGQGVNNITGYSGWRSLVDNNGNLIANVRDLNALANGFNVNVTKNAGAVRTDGGLYYLDRNYKINLTSGTSTNFDVQFFFTDAELTALQTAAPNATLANLNATRQTGTTCQANFDIVNGTPSLLAQTGNGTSNGANWITVNTPGFSNFYIMGGTQPLNIELKEISALNVGERNRVDWTTASEDKGDYFIVERSADARSFSKVGELNAKGQASGYSFWDQTPVAGINYYRLKLVSASGSFSYSKVVTATVKSTNNFVVEAYPNPVTDQVTVTAYGQQGINASISICDVTGKVLRVIEVTGASAKINMSSMASGLYLIKYSDSNHSQTVKINKQ